MINYNSCATQNAINEVILEFNSVGIGSTTILPSQTGIGYSGISTVGTAYTMPTQSDLETKVNQLDDNITTILSLPRTIV